MNVKSDQLMRAIWGHVTFGRNSSLNDPVYLLIQSSDIKFQQHVDKRDSSNIIA